MSSEGGPLAGMQGWGAAFLGPDTTSPGTEHPVDRLVLPGTDFLSPPRVVP